MIPEKKWLMTEDPNIMFEGDNAVGQLKKNRFGTLLRKKLMQSWRNMEFHPIGAWRSRNLHSEYAPRKTD
jgi:hypothetical protein